MGKSTLKIDRYCPLVMRGFSNFLGLFQVLMANHAVDGSEIRRLKPVELFPSFYSTIPGGCSGVLNHQQYRRSWRVFPATNRKKSKRDANFWMVTCRRAREEKAEIERLDEVWAFRGITGITYP